MIKQKYILSLISLSLFIPTTIYADCTKEEIDNFKEIQDEYKVTYEFDINSKTYTVYLANPDFNNYVYNNEIFGETKYKVTKEDDKIKIIGLEPRKYEFMITGTSTTCKNVLKTISVDLPKYNKYYEDPLCVGNEEFVLCQSTYEKDIDYETFVSRIESYKKSKQAKIIKEQSEKNHNKKNEEDEIIKFMKENALQIIIIIIFIVMIVATIILTAKSYRKSRRLE